MNALEKVLKKSVSVAVALAAVYSLHQAQAQSNPLNSAATAISSGQFFDPKNPIGAAANAGLNPMTNSLKAYDACFPAELRLQTRIYNPLVDPAVKMADRMKEFQTKLEENRKIFADVKPVPNECKDYRKNKDKKSKKDKKESDSLQYCEKEWENFDKREKEAKKKQKEYTDDQIEKAKADMDLPNALDWETLEISKDSDSYKSGKYDTESLYRKLETMAKDDCLSFGIEQFPTPVSCTKINDADYKKHLAQLIQIEKKALSCQKDRLKVISDVASCLTGKAAAIQQQVQALAGQFEITYKQHADTLTVLDNHRKERKRVLDEVIVRKILRGEGENPGNGKMYEMQKELNDLLTHHRGIWDKSADINTRLMNLEQDKKNAQAFYEADVARTAINIFMSRTKQLSDGSNPPLPAYYQSVMSRTTQMMNKQGAMQTKAPDVAGALSSVFGQVPDPAAAVAGPTGNSGALRTKADIKAAISARFGGVQFLISGNSYKNMAEDMNAEIEESFRLANAKNSGPYLRRENALNGKDGIETKRLALMKDIQEGVADARTVFVKAANVLDLPKRTPEQYGVNMNDCLGNTGNTQAMVNCFDAFRVYMYGLSQGNGQMASKFDIESRFVPLQNLSALPPQTIATLGLSMKGSQPLAPLYSISCSGLNPCIEAIERYRNKLLTDINDLKSDHDKYANAASQHIQGLGTQLSNMGSPVMGQPSLQTATNDLNAKITSLQNELSTYGVSISTEIPLIPYADWTPISGDNNPLNGFVQRPKDPISAVAGGMIDFRKNPFGSLSKGAIDAGKELQKKGAELTKYLTKMGEDEKKCKEDAKKALSDLKDRVSKEAGCLLLTGEKPIDNTATIDPGVANSLTSIANFFKGDKASSLLSDVTGCDKLIQHGISIQKIGIGEATGVISKSDLPARFHCEDTSVSVDGKVLKNGNGNDQKEIKIVTWDGKDIISIVELVSSSDGIRDCGKLTKAVEDQLDSCKKSLTSVNLDDCAATSKNLRTEVQEVVDKNQKVVPQSTSEAGK